MQAMNRRTFIGAAGATAVAAAMPTVVFAAEEESPAEAEEFDRPLSEDSERYCDRGGTTLTVEELNRIRHERVDAAGEFVKEDGTVIPAVWNKLSVLTSSYGCGGLDPAYGEGIDFLMILFDYNEEDAQHYLDMPFGKEFTEVEYAQAANLPVQEAREICEDLAARGLLFRSRYNEGAMCHHMPYIHGFWEQSVPRMFDQDFIDVMAPSFMLGKHRLGQVQSGTPLYYSIPCDEEIVSDDRVLPLNDWRAIVDRYETIAVCLCCCSLSKDALYEGAATIPAIGTPEMEEYRNSEKFDSHGHRLERCLAFGEEAEYWISIGAGRQITREECIETMERNIADGLVVQAGYTRNTAILCSCHSDCCGVLSHYRATSLEDWQASPISNNVSDYLLQYDKDSCLQCGACAELCPMVAIAMDEDGFPAVDEYCVRCGQCGLVCPVGARTLTARPENGRMPVPDNHMDDHNRKFGYRVQHGLA